MSRLFRRLQAQDEAHRTKRKDWRLLAFEQQRAAIDDPAPAVACKCSGRAGKSTAALLKWLTVAEERPRRLSVYIALTLDSAMRIIWSEAQRFNDAHNIGLKFLKGEHTIVHPNGSSLVLIGANRDDLIDVLRGFAIALAIFEEAAFWRRALLDRAVNDAVRIRLFDLGGQLWVISSPGLLATGYFHAITSGKQPGWSVHKWSFIDNPYLPLDHQDETPEQRRQRRIDYREATRIANGWSLTHPTYLREWCGEDATDSEAQVYPYDSTVHDVPCMPESFVTQRHLWTVVIGADYGHNNATAYTVGAFSEGSPDIWFARSEKRTGLLADTAGDWLAEWCETYKPDVVVGDAGGLGKPYVEQARQRNQLPIEAAEKAGKRAHQELLASALRSRPRRVHVVAPDCEPLCSEWEQLQWDPRYQAPDPRYRMTEDPRAENDSSDSALYTYMRMYAWLEAFEAEQPKPRPLREDPDPTDIGTVPDPMLGYAM